MYTHSERWPNGDYFTVVNQYKCDRCGCRICESHPKYEDYAKNYHLCVECGFLLGKLSEKDYLRFSPWGSIVDHAGVHEGEIHVWSGDRPPWKKPNSAFRRTSEYRNWRQAVFERDGYKCRHCGSEENLQAHHIKLFSKFKKLRYKVSNGLTLCSDCHKSEHKRMKRGDKNVRSVSDE